MINILYWYLIIQYDIINREPDYSSLLYSFEDIKVIQPLQYALRRPVKRKNITLITPGYPSMIIIGSTKGGTTTLISIMDNHLKSFYNTPESQDLFYWDKCFPCHGTIEYNVGRSMYEIVSKWNIDINNLCVIYDIKIQCSIKDYMHHIILNDTESNNINTLYITERSSSYMNNPYLAKFFGVHFPCTILLYSIREKMTQIYSRWNAFNKIQGQSILKAMNNTILYKLIYSAQFQKRILPLINGSISISNDKLEDMIVWQVLSYPFMKGLNTRLSDFCPYLNVLTYVKILEMINKQYGFSKLKIIQSEWVFDDIIRTAIYLQCIVKIKDPSSEILFNQCSRYYYKDNNIDDILSKESQRELNKTSFNKDDSYIYKGLDVEIFDKVSKYVELCDKRLFELIEKDKYKSLIVGTDWNYNRWISKRKSMRQKILII